jgi:competence protein ComEC
LRLWAAIDHLRALVNARIYASLPGERGEVAAALITGERAGISEEDNQAMRDSGLFHILSISGLHMVIMAGTVFWLVRAGLALIPSIALRASRSESGRRQPRSPRHCSTCSYPAHPCRRFAHGS